MIWVAVAIAGGFGSACRYVLDHVITARTAATLPWATFLVNVTGSLAAGAVAGLATSSLLPADWHVVAAGGFLGAYTTFSTAMYETVRLLEDRARLSALGNLLGPLLLSSAAAVAGWSIAS